MMGESVPDWQKPPLYLCEVPESMNKKRMTLALAWGKDRTGKTGTKSKGRTKTK